MCDFSKFQSTSIEFTYIVFSVYDVPAVFGTPDKGSGGSFVFRRDRIVHVVPPHLVLLFQLRELFLCAALNQARFTWQEKNQHIN